MTEWNDEEMVIDGLEESGTEIFLTAPAGKYPAIIKSIEPTETGPNSAWPGAPMLKLVFQLQDEEYTNSIYYYCLIPIGEYRESLDAEAIRKKLAQIKQLQVACGLEPSNQLDIDAMMMQEVEVVVTKKNGRDGQPENVIREVLPVS